MSTLGKRRNVIAGTTETYTWPITLTTGDVALISAAAWLVDDQTGDKTSITPVVTTTADPLVGSVAVTVPYADNLTSGWRTFRLDLDDGSGNPIAAFQSSIFVEAAAALRT